MSFLSRLRRRPRLAILLERAARAPRHREAFYRALLEERLWVPGTVRGGDVYLQPFDLDGRRTILAFTSRRGLDDALRSHAGALELPGRTLLAALPPFDAVVLDYATRLQKELTPSEVAALLAGTIGALLADDASVERMIVGRPKDYPVRLLDELRPHLERQSAVRAAYLCQVQREGSGAARIVIGLAGDAGDAGDAVALVASIAAASGTDVDAVALGDDATSEFMRRETEPWWKREEAEET